MTNVMVSDLVRHKPGCTATEDGLKLEILDLDRVATVREKSLENDFFSRSGKSQGISILVSEV